MKTFSNLLGWFLLVLVILAVGSLKPAQAAGTVTTAQAITCPAAGTSIQAIAASAARESYLVTNTSGATIRIGFLPSGTAALTDSNSIKLLAGQIFADSAPSVFIGRVVCMSDDATPDTIYIVESRRQ